MITVTASYVSGDRDNHRCGVWVAACNLFNDTARRQGLAVRYACSERRPDDTAVVAYVVDVPTAPEALALLEACQLRGLATRTHLAITCDRDAEAAWFRNVGYFPARR